MIKDSINVPSQIDGVMMSFMSQWYQRTMSDLHEGVL